MARDTKWIPQGVIPAVLLPFQEDLSIDQPSFRAHLSDVAAVQGLSAITINAHSTEVASCTFDEQKGVLAIAKDEIETACRSCTAYTPKAVSRRHGSRRWRRMAARRRSSFS